MFVYIVPLLIQRVNHKVLQGVRLYLIGDVEGIRVAKHGLRDLLFDGEDAFVGYEGRICWDGHIKSNIKTHYS